MRPAKLSTMLKPFFTQKPEKSVEGKPYSRNTVKANSFRAGQIFSGFLQRKPILIVLYEVFKPANEALNPSLKDLARQGLISFTKHKHPISSEDLEVLYAANQRDLNPPKSSANSAWFNTILYFGKSRGRVNQREMKPGDLELKTTTSRLEYFILSERATKNQSTFKCSRFYTFCVSRL